MLVRTMIQEVGCDVGSKRIVWVKVNPDYEILFRLMDGLRPDAGRRYWIKEYSAEGDIGDMGEELGQMATEVKIAFPVSHNELRIDAARRCKTTPLIRSQPPHNPQLD
jgi:hypothetical protein